jgi:hypothetical protein
VYNLCCRKDLLIDEAFDDRMAHTEFFGCLLQRYPAVLLLERLDFVISAQAGHPRCVPTLFLSGFVPESIQDCCNAFVRTYLR